jgi:hypothetical protein
MINFIRKVKVAIVNAAVYVKDLFVSAVAAIIGLFTTKNNFSIIKTEGHCDLHAELDAVAQSVDVNASRMNLTAVALDALVNHVDQIVHSTDDKLTAIFAVNYLIFGYMVGCRVTKDTVDFKSIEIEIKTTSIKQGIALLEQYEAKINEWITRIHDLKTTSRKQPKSALVQACRFYGLDNQLILDENFKVLFDLLKEEGVTCL